MIISENYQRKREVKTGDTTSISSLSWSQATLKKVKTIECTLKNCNERYTFKTT